MKSLHIFLVILIAISIPASTLNVTMVIDNCVTSNHELVLGELERHEPICIMPQESFSLYYNFPGNGTPDDPFIIEGIEIVSNDSTPCIESFRKTTGYFLFRNCRFIGEVCAELLGGNIKISACEFISSMTAIRISGFQKMISFCHIESENIGILVQLKYDDYSPDGVILTYNVISEINNYGIILSDVNDCLLANNLIHDCKKGVYVCGNRTTIRNNTIHDCQLGIELHILSNNNSIYYNRLFNNTDNAQDWATSNQWDDGVSLGNYYDDAVMGEVYHINPPQYTPQPIDHYPVLYETSPPEILEINNITIYSNMEEQHVTWNATDQTPWHYWVYLNGSLYASGVWNNSQITVDLTGLNVGHYNLTLVVIDMNYNYASSYCRLSVVEHSLNPVTIVIVTSGTLIVIVVALLRRRR